MKNPFLTLLEDPGNLIVVEFDKYEKETIVKAIEEKVDDAYAKYSNPENHDGIYNTFDEWLYYLNNMWNGKLDYTFEQWAYTIGIQKYELYKMILGILVDKHLDYVCEHETNIDDDIPMLDNDELNTVINDPNSKYDCNGQLDNDTLNALRINR